MLDPRSANTAGFTLLADTLLPIVPTTRPAVEGQDELFVADLFEEGEALAGVTLERFRLRPGEDASCLNLYQAKDPRVLAPTPAFVAEGRFAFGATAAETPDEEANPWLLLDREFADGAIPAIADSTSLNYALHIGIGDDFVLNRDTDRPITLRIVGALSDSIFQRELLISEAHFERVFPDYEGYRFFLIDAPPARMADVSAALEDRLVDFGFDVVSAGERLAAFHRVENTYLATFQTLGGLGLILGTFGLGAVLLRNVLERRRELALMRAVGYNARHLSLMVLAENAFLLFAGLVTGTRLRHRRHRPGVAGAGRRRPVALARRPAPGGRRHRVDRFARGHRRRRAVAAPRGAARGVAARGARRLPEIPGLAWRRCCATFASPYAPWAGSAGSRWPRSPRWRSASAPTRRCSASSTAWF